MNYTKGEWKVNILDDHTIAIRAEYMDLMARIATIFNDSKENEANANLIAAAPKLHKAGKNALVSLKLWANEHPDDEVLAMVITELEYALAKVEGG